MANILHILNSDGAAKIFSEAKLQGDVLVFREMLCEGPLEKDVASDAFWKKRYTFFETEFNVPQLEYFDNTIKELVQLQDVYQYDEIVLWFEYDLFCQVNLMALCSMLLDSFVKKINYYLVCVGPKKGKTPLLTLADYKPSQYVKLYEEKIKITKHDLTFMQNNWQVYVANNKATIASHNFGKSHKFRFLYKAMQQQLLRFPDVNGYNQIENKIQGLQNQGVVKEADLISALLSWQEQETVYGFGDLQYKWYVKNLKSS